MVRNSRCWRLNVRRCPLRHHVISCWCQPSASSSGRALGLADRHRRACLAPGQRQPHHLSAWQIVRVWRCPNIGGIEVGNAPSRQTRGRLGSSPCQPCLLQLGQPLGAIGQRAGGRAEGIAPEGAAPLPCVLPGAWVQVDQPVGACGAHPPRHLPRVDLPRVVGDGGGEAAERVGARGELQNTWRIDGGSRSWARPSPVPSLIDARYPTITPAIRNTERGQTHRRTPRRPLGPQPFPQRAGLLVCPATDHRSGLQGKLPIGVCVQHEAHAVVRLAPQVAQGLLAWAQAQHAQDRVCIPCLRAHARHRRAGLWVVQAQAEGSCASAQLHEQRHGLQCSHQPTGVRAGRGGLLTSVMVW